MEEKKMVIVRNRNAGSTGYTLDNGFHRNFQYNEKKRIPLEELEQLSYAPGGEEILKNCLVIEDKNALEYLNLQVEPEYYYTEEDVKKILLEGTLDQLEDTLNFAPSGVIEMLKNFAVEYEVPDTRKRKMITEKTGFDIQNAITINTILAEGEEEEPKKAEPVKRKATPIKKEAGVTRKTTPPQKYKIVSES